MNEPSVKPNRIAFTDSNAVKKHNQILAVIWNAPWWQHIFINKTIQAVVYPNNKLDI